VVAHLALRRAGEAAIRERSEIPLDLERGARRISALHRHAKPGRKGRVALSSYEGIIVDWAMRYGNPTIASRIERLTAQGCDRLLAFPLYPQYAAPTTATANDKVFDALKTMRAQPALRTVPPYPDYPVYIDAIAESIRAHLRNLDFEPEVILASFHGLPQDYVDQGDPYQQQCLRTIEALRNALGPLGAKLKLTFQSRFGRADWIEPYTDKTVEALARDGSSGLPSSAQALPPIALRRLRRSRRRTRTSSSSMAAKSSATFLASMTATKGSKCWFT
jgi:ferrochelatase